MRRNDDTLPSRGPAIAAIVIAFLAFLPIVNWIPGGHAAPEYGQWLTSWTYGALIAIGLGLLFAIASASLKWLWRENAAARAGAWFARHPRSAPLVLAGAALALYALIARVVFDARPLFVDEIVQMVQAQILAHGHLSLPTDPYPAFFSGLNIVDANGRYFAQFPVGGPAMLALGALVHAPWLVGPLFGAIAVVAFAAFVRRAEPRSTVALGAVLVFAFAPFTAFMAGTYMNHVTTLAWIALALAALAAVMTAESPHPWLAFASGLGFGIAATIRPVDALAFALPAGVWYLARAVRARREWTNALAAAAGVAIPLALLLWANARTTGSPLLFGYSMLWGKSHALGFHAAPWGISHTPARGLELVNLYLLRLQTYFLETPVPALVPALVALGLSRRLGALDRYLLASSALLLALYFAYWHDGFYLGPRFMYPLLPVLSLWTARALPAVRERVGATRVYRTAVYTACVSVAIALLALVPLRGRQYAEQLDSMRWSADSSAAREGVRHALVFVRESWGAQLVARLWALGVTRPQTELLYNNVDACRLELATAQLESSGTHGAAAFAALQPLLADSARLVTTSLSPDSSERMLPGSTYPDACVNHVKEDQAGFTVFLPLLLAHGGDNIYARDLGARDSLLERRYPNRKVYLLKPGMALPGMPPRFWEGDQ